MKTWTVRFRKVDRARFEEVRSRRKRIETRAATQKYARLLPGDAIKFVCGKESFRMRIKSKHHFKSPAGMIKKLPLKYVMPDVKTLAEVKKRYEQYPEYPAKIKKFGIYAFELTPLR